MESQRFEPAAADFYFGEMEMRRHGLARSSIERWILSLYYFFSGYALRASRPFASLGAVPVFGTLGLMWFGAALGSAVETSVRVLAPTFLALGVPAIRSKVKR